MSAELPAGFTLDQPQAAGATLPPGFTLDPPAAPQAKTPSRSRYGLQDFTPKVPAEVAAAAGSGLAGSVLGGYAGLWGSILPGEEGQGAQWSQAVQEALTYQPRTQGAKDILNVAALPGKAVSYVSEKVGERGAEVSPLLGAVGKTSVEALPLLLGARAMTKPKPALTPKQQQVAAARDAGFRMTPEEMGAGPVSRTAGSISGEPRLARGISNRNTAVAVRKAKSELGIRPDSTIDLDTLADIRKTEGRAYESVRNAGQVTMDQKYLSDLDALLAKYRSAAEDFPGAAKELGMKDAAKVVDSLKGKGADLQAVRDYGVKITPDIEAKMATSQTFSANSAVDLISLMRDRADALFRSANAADKGLAKVYRGAAQALDDQILRHLGQTGQATKYRDYVNARTRIAKTYTVEKALVGDDVVNMQELGRQVKARKPLTGGLKETGDFARNFSRSAQKQSNIGTGGTAHDLALALLQRAGSAGGNLLVDALTFGVRPALRSILASRPMQYLMDPRTRTSSAAQQAVGASQVIPRQEERP